MTLTSACLKSSNPNAGVGAGRDIPDLQEKQNKRQRSSLFGKCFFAVAGACDRLVGINRFSGNFADFSRSPVSPFFVSGRYPRQRSRFPVNASRPAEVPDYGLEKDSPADFRREKPGKNEENQTAAGLPAAGNEPRVQAISAPESVVMDALRQPGIEQ